MGSIPPWHLMENAVEKIDSPFITASEAAKRYGVSTETIRRWARRGWIQTIRIGRKILIDPDALERRTGGYRTLYEMGRGVQS
jgi:excisionase family DNA binding protein